MRAYGIFMLALAGWFIVDQNIKALFLEGYYREGACIDWVLHRNTGVAFSMFASLGDALKWVQAVLIAGMGAWLYKERMIAAFPTASAMLFAGALSNLYDRFAHGAVIDYVAWHCGFRWPVFNLADVLIDIAAAWLLFGVWQREKRS